MKLLRHLLPLFLLAFAQLAVAAHAVEHGGQAAEELCTLCAHANPLDAALPVAGLPALSFTVALAAAPAPAQTVHHAAPLAYRSRAPPLVLVVR